jgi:hypothetical protein
MRKSAINGRGISYKIQYSILVYEDCAEGGEFHKKLLSPLSQNLANRIFTPSQLSSAGLTSRKNEGGLLGPRLRPV